MRCLLLTSDNNGEPRAFIIALGQDETAEDVRVADAVPDEIGSRGDQVSEDAPTFIVELPDDEYRPAVFDGNGEEISVSFVD